MDIEKYVCVSLFTRAHYVINFLTCHCELLLQSYMLQADKVRGFNAPVMNQGVLNCVLLFRYSEDAAFVSSESATIDTQIRRLRVGSLGFHVMYLENTKGSKGQHKGGGTLKILVITLLVYTVFGVIAQGVGRGLHLANFKRYGVALLYVLQHVCLTWYMGSKVRLVRLYIIASKSVGCGSRPLGSGHVLVFVVFFNR